MKFYAIIVAGGSGRRMNSALPKQFIPLLGKPILMHTIDAFYQSSTKPEIILVLNSSSIPYWEKLCRDYSFDVPHLIVKGGDERFFSVKNALETIENEGIAAIHDAVRPIVSKDLIERAFYEATKQQAVIPVMESRDSIRKLETNGNTQVVPRSEILLVQTPQVFQVNILKKAYHSDYLASFTDDASVVEAMGINIHTIQGESTNIKITYNEDLAIAELLMKRKKEGEN